MKKLYGIFLMILALGMLGGCSKKDPDTNTVYIGKDGSVTEAAVEAFDKDYYKQEELESFIQDEIAEYEKTHEEKQVKLESFTVEEGTAKLLMDYESYQDYQDFNGRELFAGTVVQAIAAGYSFNTDFLPVEDGKIAGEADTESTESPADAVSGSEVTKNEDYRVVVINEDTDVVVKGSIKYVSAGSVTLKDKKTASVQTVNEGVSYIVYK